MRGGDYAPLMTAFLLHNSPLLARSQRVKTLLRTVLTQMSYNQFGSWLRQVRRDNDCLTIDMIEVLQTPCNLF